MSVACEMTYEAFREGFLGVMAVAFRLKRPEIEHGVFQQTCTTLGRSKYRKRARSGTQAATGEVRRREQRGKRYQDKVDDDLSTCSFRSFFVGFRRRGRRRRRWETETTRSCC